MCRMVACLGRVPAADVLEGFVRMARGENERHERNPTLGEYVHGDGWGVVYTEHGAFQRYRSVQPCWEDPKLGDFADKQIIVLHARQASRGDVTLENTHPLQCSDDAGEWFFCHNGTIDDPLPQYDDLIGETDSERLFRYILQHFNPHHDVENLRRSIDPIKNYTAINSFLLNRDALYVINRYDEAQKTPTYYTIYRYEDRERLIFASERLPLFAEDNWEPLSNGTIIKIHLNDWTTFIETEPQRS